MKRIATHKNPDADALAALYLAETYLFAGEPTTIAFMGRTPPHDGWTADCLVDVGNEYDPARLRFDHKPPACADRNATCASKLLYEYLFERGDTVVQLAGLVQTVWEGDANPPRKPSPALVLSRAAGGGDAAVYEGARSWLSIHDRALREAAAEGAD